MEKESLKQFLIRTYYWQLLIASLFLGCNQSRVITIALENNSDLLDKITIEVYRDSHMIDRKIVINDTLIGGKLLLVATPLSKAISQTFKFSVVETNEETSCTIQLDSITKKSVIHVNYLEMLFKKGYLFKTYVLDKDTIVDKNFYCEVMYNRNQ